MQTIVIELLKILFCAAAVATIAMTVTKAVVFAKLRESVKKRSKFFGDLLSCPYCFSHWTAFLIVAVFQPRPIQTGSLVLDLLLSAFAIVAIAPAFAWLIFHSYSSMPKSEDNESEKDSFPKK